VVLDFSGGDGCRLIWLFIITRRRNIWLRYTTVETAFWLRLGVSKQIANASRRFNESRGLVYGLWVLMFLWLLLALVNGGSYLHFKYRFFSKKPAQAESFYNAGVSKYDSGNYVGAIADFTKAIENYYLTVKSDKIHLFYNQVRMYPEINLPPTKILPAVKFTEKDALYNKTATLIANNEQKRGWLYYQITNVTWEQIADTNNQWVVSYDDSDGQRYYVTNNNSYLSGRGIANLPGAELPVQQ
jgi:hypothetical protein